MWLLHVIAIGFYDIRIWPVHLPLWVLGYWIRSKVQSTTAHIIWPIIFAVGILLSELSCHFLFTGYDCLVGLITMAVLLDLAMGYLVRSVKMAFQPPTG